MQLAPNLFKQALQQHQQQLGLFLGIPSAYSAEILANTGFDLLLIDTEHAPIDLPTALAQMQAISAYSAQIMIRMCDHDTKQLKRWLDAGVQNVMFPMVESRAQAESLVDAMRYPPQGTRGVAPAMSRAARWGAITDYLQVANAQMGVVLQIESVAGVEHAEEIIAVEGVDAIFIGPADLAASMGYLGQAQHPEVQKTIQQLIQQARKHHKSIGIYTSDTQQAAAYRAQGVNLLVVGVDTLLLRQGAQQLVQKFKE